MVTSWHSVTLAPPKLRAFSAVFATQTEGVGVAEQFMAICWVPVAVVRMESQLEAGRLAVRMLLGVSAPEEAVMSCCTVT